MSTTQNEYTKNPSGLKTLFCILIAGIMISSCEKILDVDLPDSDRRIVINSIFNTDSVFEVNLSKSLHVLDNNQMLFLPGASMKLYENDVFIDSLIYIENGNYTTDDFFPSAGKKYRLEVDYLGLNHASAENSIPDDIEILSVDTMSVKRNDENKIKCTLKFKDPSGSNYYVLKAYRYFRYDNYELGTTDSSFSYIYIDSDDPVIDTDGGLMGEIIFTDELFNDKEYNLYLYISEWDVCNYDMSSDSAYVYFQLRSVSPEYFYYTKSLNQYYNTHGNPFSEPVQVYSNVKNGFGIFAGFSNSTRMMIFSGYTSDDYYME